MSAKIEKITTAELVSRQWYVNLAWEKNETISEYRERFNQLDWDALLMCIGVELTDNECVEVSDADFNDIHQQYTVTFSRC